jgi:hypothetical protein
MLPSIRQHATVSFRHLNPKAREEAIQEVVCNALQAYVRLVQLKKVALAYPTVLAKFAVAQVKDNRKVGGKLNVLDISSPYCQQRKKITVERLDHFDEEEGHWQEALIEDKNTGPANIATIRIDFTEWLRSLPGRLRRIAKLLATGEKPGIVAKKFNVCPGRISQIRKELYRAWQDFQGELVPLA